MRIPVGLFKIAKEVLRHLLRRPVVGICMFAKTEDGRILLIRRGDTSEWALPGGTVEWGETFRGTVPRELMEEAGVEVIESGELLGVYSDPKRDPRFHATTVVVAVTVSEPIAPPDNPAEILEVGLFQPGELPTPLSHGNQDMLENAIAGRIVWE